MRLRSLPGSASICSARSTSSSTPCRKASCASAHSPSLLLSVSSRKSGLSASASLAMRYCSCGTGSPPCAGFLPGRSSKRWIEKSDSRTYCRVSASSCPADSPSGSAGASAASSGSRRRFILPYLRCCCSSRSRLLRSSCDTLELLAKKIAAPPAGSGGGGAPACRSRGRRSLSVADSSAIFSSKSGSSVFTGRRSL